VNGLRMKCIVLSGKSYMGKRLSMDRDGKIKRL